MKTETVFDEEVRVTRRGPRCHVEVNVSPNRRAKGSEKGHDWVRIDVSSEMPSYAGLQTLVRRWKRKRDDRS